jgi:hypothetical protein
MPPDEAARRLGGLSLRTTTFTSVRDGRLRSHPVSRSGRWLQPQAPKTLTPELGPLHLERGPSRRASGSRRSRSRRRSRRFSSVPAVDHAARLRGMYTRSTRARSTYCSSRWDPAWTGRTHGRGAGFMAMRRSATTGVGSRRGRSERRAGRLRHPPGWDGRRGGRPSGTRLRRSRAGGGTGRPRRHLPRRTDRQDGRRRSRPGI